MYVVLADMPRKDRVKEKRAAKKMQRVFKDLQMQHHFAGVTR
jgi:hypothetical protein